MKESNMMGVLGTVQSSILDEKKDKAKEAVLKESAANTDDLELIREVINEIRL